MESLGVVAFSVTGPDEGTVHVEFFGEENDGRKVVAEFKLETEGEEGQTTIVILNNSTLVRLANTLDELLQLT